MFTIRCKRMVNMYRIPPRLHGWIDSGNLCLARNRRIFDRSDKAFTISLACNEMKGWLRVVHGLGAYQSREG